MVGIQPTQYQTSFKEWTLMLEVNIPLQQDTRRAQERESEAMLAAARSRREAVANQVLSDLAENLAGIEAARRIETLATTSLQPQAELTFNSALAEFTKPPRWTSPRCSKRSGPSGRPGKTRSRPGSRGRSGWLKSKNYSEKSYETRHWRLTIGVAAVVMLAAGGGYWLGHRGSAPTAPGASAAMPGASAPAGDTAKQEKKLLYYRNPMGLPDTSPVPKKDPMGMDYIAVYAGGDESEPAAPGQIRISTEKVQKLGVRTEAARSRTLDRTVRAAGRVEPDERRVYAIAPKFEGYVERLLVNVTGQPVRKGQPLFEVYSPELVSAQREYAIAMQGVASLKDAGGTAQTGMQQLAESSLQRLRSWDISDEQIKALASSGEAKRTLTFRSTASGIVTEKKAVQGMRFMPGEALYQVADLSSVWVIADVFEQDIGLIKSGATAKIRINAYPGKPFEGKVTYVYPTLKAETRTVPVRVELANPGLLLKPAMFAQVEVSVSAKGSVVTVPVSAVIDSGTRQIVLIQRGEGRFEPREVRLGARSDTDVEVIEGVKDGEAGGGGGQLPDRRREQPEGSDRRLQQRPPCGACQG
jgi:Cu(I)/Ag(I) efflux system membrane fusion protein